MTATLKSRKPFWRGLASVSLYPAVSISSGPAMTPRPISRSSALRLSGPITEMSAWDTRPGNAWPRGGTMPQVGL